MNVTVSVECFKMLMRKKENKKTFFVKSRTHLPKKWFKPCSYGHRKPLSHYRVELAHWISPGPTTDLLKLDSGSLPTYQ